MSLLRAAATRVRLPRRPLGVVLLIAAAVLAGLAREDARSGGGRSSAETWVLKGYAVGKNAGNDSAGGVSMADVIRLDGGTYRMYYDQMGASGFAIKYAESSDAVNWTVKGTVLRGASSKSDREYSVKGPSVLELPDGRYRMYYQAGPQTGGGAGQPGQPGQQPGQPGQQPGQPGQQPGQPGQQPGQPGQQPGQPGQQPGQPGQQPGQSGQPGEEPKFHVRSAVSADGVSFTREGVRIEISSVQSSSPLKLAGHGTYYIARDGTVVGIFSGNFKNEMGPSELVMATSKDGLTFGNIKRLYDDWHDPIVLKVPGGYRMYATYLLEKQGVAFSADGLKWPAKMTPVTFTDGKGKTLTEENVGLGDFAGVVLGSGAIRLFGNYGNPSNDIAYFDSTGPLESPGETPATETHDVAVTSFAASPNPVKAGAMVTLSYTVSNRGTATENGLTFQLTFAGKALGAPQSVPALDPGAKWSSRLVFQVPGSTRKGAQLATARVSTAAGETSVGNNKRNLTVKVR